MVAPHFLPKNFGIESITVILDMPVDFNCT